MLSKHKIILVLISIFQVDFQVDLLPLEKGRHSRTRDRACVCADTVSHTAQHQAHWTPQCDKHRHLAPIGPKRHGTRIWETRQQHGSMGGDNKGPQQGAYFHRAQSQHVGGGAVAAAECMCAPTVRLRVVALHALPTVWLWPWLAAGELSDKS